MLRVNKMRSKARDEEVSMLRSCTAKEFKRRPSAGRRECICKAGVEGGRGSLIIEVERRVHELGVECWEELYKCVI